MSDARPRFSVFIAVTLDGFIARRDGGIDFLSAVQSAGEDYGYQAFFDSVNVLVMGRKTYETALGFPEWPFGDKRVVVLTHRPVTPRHNEEFMAGSAAEVAKRLSGAGRVYIDGGDVIRQFLAAELVDDLTLSVVPVMLGDGVSLFDRGSVEQRLVLESSRAYATGLVQLRYRVER